MQSPVRKNQLVIDLQPSAGFLEIQSMSCGKSLGMVCGAYDIVAHFWANLHASYLALPLSSVYSTNYWQSVTIAVKYPKHFHPTNALIYVDFRRFYI